MKNTIILAFSLFIISSLSTGVKASPTSLHQPMESIAGTWYGFMYCTNINYLFDLKITPQKGYEITAKFNSKLYAYSTGKKMGGSVYPRNIELALRGQFFDEQSVFSLQTEGVPVQQRLRLRGLLDPVSNRISAEVTMPHYGSCSLAIAGKKEIKKTLKKIQKKAHFMPKLFGRPASTDVCDGPMKSWLDAAEPMMKFDFDYRNPQSKLRFKYTAMEMLQDKRFKPHFGKSFSKLSPKKMGFIYHKLANGCSRNRPRGQSRKKIMSHLFQVIQNQKELPRSELALYLYTKQILSNWKKSAINELPQLTSEQTELLSSVAQSLLTPLWPTQDGNINKEVQLAKNRSFGNKMLADLETARAQTPMTFQRLAELSKFIDSYRSVIGVTPKKSQSNRRKIRRQQVMKRGNRASLTNNLQFTPETLKQANSLIKEAINQHTLDAALPFSKSITTATAVIKHLNPIKNGEYKSFVNYLDADKVVQLDKIFQSRKQQLLNTYLTTEQNKYQSISKAVFNLHQLQQLNTYETGLKQQYSTLLNEPTFDSFNQLRTENRRAQLNNNMKAIEDHFKTLNDLSGLDKSLATLIITEDKHSPQAKIVDGFYRQQRKNIAPFIDFAGGNYLNAIYQGDFASVKSQDRANGRETADRFDSIMEGLAPGTPNPYSMHGLANKMTLIKPIAAIYMFNYQSTSKKCLKANHPIFKVTKTVPDVVTTNGYGWEIGRIYGYSTETDYSINQEFVRLFRIVGNSEPTSFSSGLFDNIVGSGKMGEVISGTKLLMQKFDCNSKQIKQFEKNLNAYALQVLH